MSEPRRKLSRKERRAAWAKRQASLSGEELHAYKGARRECSKTYKLGAKSVHVMGSAERLMAIAVEKKAERERLEAEAAKNTPPPWLMWFLVLLARAKQNA